MTIAETETFMVPLNKLTISEKNVRKTNAADIDDLLASIPVHGLIQNLNVQQTEKAGHFAVVAGGRRMRALKRLAKEKIIAKDYPVKCSLVTSDAEALSLAENVIRAPMHPADQFDAFKQQIDAGKSIEETADAFGVSGTVVKKRMKLAAVAPEIMKAFRKDEIDLNAVAAYTLSDDQERQRAVFKALSRGAASWQIKKALTEGNIALSDKRVRFVTLEAYEAAGGGVIRDLFAERGDEAYLTDAALLDRLFAEKIEAVLEPVKAEGWQEVLYAPEGYYSISEKYRGRVYPTRRELSPEEEQQQQAMIEELDALGVEVEDDPDNEKLAARWQELSDRIDAMMPEIYQPEDVAKAVAVACFDYNGNLTIHRGLTVKNRSCRAAEKVKPSTDADGIPLVSAKLQTELAAIRTAAVAADLAANASVALAVTVHTMACKLFTRYRSTACQIDVTDARTSGQIRNKDMRPLAFLAGQLEEKRRAAPQNPADLWLYFAGMPQANLLDHLALFMALSLDGFAQYGSAEQRVNADQIAEALDTKPEQWMTLSDLEYFSRTPKAHILAAVAKVKGKDRADNIATMKKADLVERATAELDGQWLPATLSRFARDADIERAEQAGIYDDPIEGQDEELADDSTADDLAEDHQGEEE